jgi:hypothetical protein
MLLFVILVVGGGIIAGLDSTCSLLVGGNAEDGYNIFVDDDKSTSTNTIDFCIV